MPSAGSVHVHLSGVRNHGPPTLLRCTPTPDSCRGDTGVTVGSLDQGLSLVDPSAIASLPLTGLPGFRILCFGAALPLKG